MILKAANSKIIVGYDLGNVNSQISYYSAQTSKVETAPSVVGTKIYNIPTLLCKRYGANQWLYGKEAIRVSEAGEGILVDHLLTLARDEEPIMVEEQPYDPVALLTLFLRKSLSLLSTAGTVERIGAFLITCEQMDVGLIKVLERALAGVGLKAKHICFQSYEESFYQYMIHQPEELRRYDTVMFRCDGPSVKAFRMTCNQKTAPRAVFVDEETYSFSDAVRENVPSEKKMERMDREFCRMAERFCRDQRISSVYLIGECFDQEWMKESLRYLCQGKRVFVGSNLYSQGACLGMMERLKPSQTGQNHVLLGRDKLKANVGMRVLRQGEDSYLALLDAGVNWYEAETQRECYVKEENALELVVAPLNGRKGKIAQMTLEGLAPGISRLSLELKMLDEERLSVTVKDLGFGEFRPASHQVWQEELNLYS